MALDTTQVRADRRHRLGGALTGAWIGARGREDAHLVRVRADARRRVEPGIICLGSNENPLGPGKTVMKAVRAAFGEGGRDAGPLLGQRRAT